MATISQLNWADKLAREAPYGPVGYNFVVNTPAVAIWGAPEVKIGYKKQQWSSGSAGGKVGTDLTYSGTDGSIDVSYLLHPAMFGSPMVVDLKAEKAGESREAQLATQQGFADADLANQFTDNLFASSGYNGQDGNLQGLNYILETDSASQRNQTFAASGSYDADDILQVLSKLKTKTANGRRAIFCSLETESAIYDRMAAVGYGPTYSLLAENFDGSPVLSWNGIPIIAVESDNLADSTSYGNTISDIYMVTFGGKQGATLFTPELGSMIEVKGPIETKKTVTDDYDAFFNIQVHAGSPLCVSKADDVITRAAS